MAIRLQNIQRKVYKQLPDPDKTLWMRAIILWYRKNPQDISAFRVVRLFLFQVPYNWFKCQMRKIRRKLKIKTKLKPKQLTPKQMKWMMILSFTMAVFSVTINHVTDIRWLYWVSLAGVWSVPAYIWFEPWIKQKINLYRSRHKFDAFEDEIGKPPKSIYNQSHDNKI